MPLEGLWFSGDAENKSNWKWKSLIMQPHFVKKEHISQTKEETALKKDLPSLDKIEFIELE